MGVPSKPITKAQFMKYFGRLQELLVLYRKPETGYYLTDVVIEDIPKSQEIAISFDVEYGPVADYDGYGDVNAEMLECKFKYIYSRNGIFRSYKGTEPKDRFDFKPDCYLPSFEDFPDPEDIEDGLFDIISCIISKCLKCGKLLHSIQFCTPAPSYEYDFIDGKAPRYGDDGYPSEFNSKVTGLSLTNEMLDTYLYSYNLVASKEVMGEYDLYFWVSIK